MSQGKATEKDVRYAMQYAGEKLIKTITHGTTKAKAEYTLTPSNKVVTEHTFYAVSDNLIEDDRGLFDGYAQSYRWKQDA